MSNPHVMVVEARFYNHIADEMMKSVVAELEAANATWEAFSVPGSFELPGAIRMAIEAADSRPPERRFDGFIALGCVIRGETSHYDYVCAEKRPRAERTCPQIRNCARLRHSHDPRPESRPRRGRVAANMIVAVPQPAPVLP